MADKTSTTSATEPDEQEKSGKKLTGKAAMLVVLKAAGEPLKTAEIVQRALALEGLALQGKTPGASLTAALAVENKKSDGLFERVAPGTYKLRAHE